MKAIFANWKTSLLGITAVLHGLFTVASQFTGGAAFSIEQMQFGIGEVVAGAGLILARDADKTSRDSGIR